MQQWEYLRVEMSDRYNIRLMPPGMVDLTPLKQVYPHLEIVVQPEEREFLRVGRKAKYSQLRLQSAVLSLIGEQGWEVGAAALVAAYEIPTGENYLFFFKRPKP